MGQDIHYVLDTSALSAPPLVVLIIQRSHTYPVCNVMHGHHANITNVGCTLTELSHMIGGQQEEANSGLHLSQAPSRQGMLRSHICADRGFAWFSEAGKSQQDVPSGLATEKCANSTLDFSMTLGEPQYH